MSSSASSSTSSSVAPVPDASNVPPPGQSASPVTGTSIDVPVTGDTDNFIDNYNLDAEGGDDYTLCQKMVHYCGGHIITEHLPACKAVLVFHAGCSICKLSSMTKVVKEAAMLELYNASIAALDEIHFGDSARLFFSRSFRKKDEPLTAESLYRYYHDSRAKMRNQLLPLFPKDFVTMKTGRGFHESCNDVYIKAYRDEMAKMKRGSILKYTKPEVDAMLPPHLWEYSKAPWLFGLAMKIFRRDPQLAPNVADVLTDAANIPISRAEMKRQKQAAAFPGGSSAAKINKKDNQQHPTITCSTTPAAPRIGTKRGASDDVRSQIDPTTTKKLLWAKVIASKAQAENTNIAKRMGKMEELEKGMALLEKMRSVIGEKSYAEKVQSVFAAFPVFATFDACVEVIDDDAVSLPNIAVGDDSSSIFRTPLPPSLGVPRYVRVASDEAELAPAANDEDDISGEEAMDNFPRTNTLLPVINFAALNADGGDYTDEEWATYLKIRQDKKERLEELEKEHETLPSSSE